MFTKIALKSKRIDRFYRIKAHFKALIQPFKMSRYTTILIQWLVNKGGGHRGVPLYEIRILRFLLFCTLRGGWHYRDSL